MQKSTIKKNTAIVVGERIEVPIADQHVMIVIWLQRIRN
jgi:hypothetical protein